MRDDVLAVLRCPVCGDRFARRERTLRCGRGHSFDLARQGYVSLLAGRAPAGDTPAMVAARERFLAAGRFRWLADRITSQARALAAPPPSGTPLVLDAGAGTGYYLAAVLDAVPAVGVAVDSSAAALRRAARAHPRIGAVRADLWQPLPVVDHGVDLVLNVFAPRNGAEFRRVLADDGVLLTVTPTAAHLGELVHRLGLVSVDAEKDRRLADALGRWFEPEVDERVDVPLRLDHREVDALVGMGPSARHIDPAVLADRIECLPDTVPVTTSCRIMRWHPR